ncbi:MAG: YqiA/YcfP family alpha/beta fold hydrolase, partial [Kangiellaceae bacterium]|nr:YqiA/YcfP family alpha/beta fold hydrolase [Kangiellaceae bacterium]
TIDPENRVLRLSDILKYEPDETILFGSSMGGYVSLVCSEQFSINGVFLLAPALYKDGYKQQEFKPSTKIEIVHGWSDDVIPWQNSVRFASEHQVKLHLMPGDHRLNSALDSIEGVFSSFLRGLK